VVPTRFLGHANDAGASQERVRTVYERMAKHLSRLIVEEGFFWAIDHDSGKTVRFPFHPLASIERIDRHSLLEQFAQDFPYFRRSGRMPMTHAVLKHHHAIGLSIIPDCSLGYIKRPFRDPEVRKLLWNGSNWDMKNVEQFLEKLLQFTLLDLGGGSINGNLTCTSAERFFRIHDQLLAEVRAAKDPEALLARLDELARAEIEERIVQAFDYMPEIESRLDAVDRTSYIPHLRAAVAGNIADGTITQADWETVLEHGHRIVESVYWITHRFSQMEANGEPRTFAAGAAQDWINPRFLKFQALRARVAQYVHDKYGKDDMTLAFIDGDGRPLGWQDGADKLLNAALLNATATPVFDGETAHLVDARGKRIENIQINVKLNDDIYGDTLMAHIQVQLTGKLETK